MRGPSAKAALAIVVAAFLVSCAGTTGNDGTTPTATAPVSESTETSRPSESNGATTGATEATIALVLAEQITSLGGANEREPTCTDEAGVFVGSRGGRRLAAARPRGHRNRRHAVCDPLVSRRFRVRKRHAGRGGWRRHLPSTLVLEGQSDEGVFTREKS